MEKDRIKKGDFVNVYFENIPCIFNAEVIYTPCSEGDCWCLVGQAGQAINVVWYSYMEKIK